MRDVNFVFETEGFNFRVGAYLTCGEKVLLQRGANSDFYNLIGGRVHVCENTVDAIKREVKEELGIEISAPKLIVVAENFFKWQGKNAHEMLFIYRKELPAKYLKILENFKVLDQEENAIWVDKSKLREYKCLPRIIYELPKIEKENEIRHIIGD